MFLALEVTIQSFIFQCEREGEEEDPSVTKSALSTCSSSVCEFATSTFGNGYLMLEMQLYRSCGYERNDVIPILYNLWLCGELQIPGCAELSDWGRILCTPSTSHQFGRNTLPIITTLDPLTNHLVDSHFQSPTLPCLHRHEFFGSCTSWSELVDRKCRKTRHFDSNPAMGLR